jgi:hypothetical protein
VQGIEKQSSWISQRGESVLKLQKAKPELSTDYDTKLATDNFSCQPSISCIHDCKDQFARIIAAAMRDIRDNRNVVMPVRKA